MSFLRKVLTEADLDRMRISLSVIELKLIPEPSCDFCGSERPIYCYASERTSTGQYVPCWRWCACENCAKLVEAQNWDQLEAHIVDWLQKCLPCPRKVLRQAAHQSFRDFIIYATRL